MTSSVSRMNPRYVGFFLIAVLFGAAFWMLRVEPAAPLDVPSGEVAAMQTYTNNAYGLSFKYPATYTLEERDASGSELRTHHAITLIPTSSLPLPENGEGPPAISIDIYQNNLDNQTTEQWIRNSSASNFKLGEGILASTTVSGLPALSYRWSGLYEGTTVALAQPAWIYAFSVTYLEMGADIIQDFVAIRESVRISGASQ